MSLVMTKKVGNYVVIAFSAPRELFSRIEKERGLIARSAYLVDLLNTHYTKLDGAKKQ